MSFSQSMEVATSIRLSLELSWPADQPEVQIVFYHLPSKDIHQIDFAKPPKLFIQVLK